MPTGAAPALVMPAPTMMPLAPQAAAVFQPVVTMPPASSGATSRSAAARDGAGRDSAGRDGAGRDSAGRDNAGVALPPVYRDNRSYLAVVEGIRRGLRRERGVREAPPHRYGREPDAALPDDPVTEAAAAISQPPPPLPAPRRAAPLERARVVIHVRDGNPASEARASVLSSLIDPSVRQLELKYVSSSPSDREIRFFYPEDYDAARELAGMLNRMGGPWHVREFSGYRSLPSAGTIEVWLPPS